MYGTIHYLLAGADSNLFVFLTGDKLGAFVEKELGDMSAYSTDAIFMHCNLHRACLAIC